MTARRASWTDVVPVSAIATSSSVRKISMARLTPAPEERFAPGFHTQPAWELNAVGACPG